MEESVGGRAYLSCAVAVQSKYVYIMTTCQYIVPLLLYNTTFINEVQINDLPTIISCMMNMKRSETRQ